jgi:hypothetical protein
MKTSRIALLLVLAAVISAAARASEPSVRDTRDTRESKDSRLDQKIEVESTDSQLVEVLDRVSKQTGVTLSAEAPLCDTVIVGRYSGALGGFMEALASFFALDKEHVPNWEKSVGEPARYTLRRDLVSSRAIASLRESRRKEVIDRLEKKVRDEPGNVGALALLTPELRQRLYAGELVEATAAEIGGSQGARHALEQILGQNAGDFGDKVSLSYFTVGSSLTGSYLIWRVREDKGERGHQITEGLSISQILEELSTEKQQEIWKKCYRGEEPTDDPSLKGFQEGLSSSQIARREALLKVAKNAGVNLIADDYGCEITGSRLCCGSLKLSTALDRICEFQLGNPTESHHGSFWRYEKGAYLVRSLSWLEEESRLIPHKLLQGWRDSEERGGQLTLNDVATMATLCPQQFPLLRIWYPKQVDAVREAQLPLLWYSRARNDLRERLRRAPGIPLTWLGVSEESVTQGYDPALPMRPIYIDLIREKSAANVSMRILSGHTDDEKKEPVVGIAFQVHDEEGRSSAGCVVDIPLKR